MHFVRPYFYSLTISVIHAQGYNEYYNNYTENICFGYPIKRIKTLREGLIFCITINENSVNFENKQTFGNSIFL